jgi:hypothetical protein
MCLMDFCKECEISNSGYNTSYFYISNCDMAATLEHFEI